MPPIAWRIFELYGEIKEELGAYDKLSLVFINSWTGEGNSRKSLQHLKSYNIPEAVCYSDKNAELYNDFGVKRLPTTPCA